MVINLSDWSNFLKETVDWWKSFPIGQLSTTDWWKNLFRFGQLSSRRLLVGGKTFPIWSRTFLKETADRWKTFTDWLTFLEETLLIGPKLP